MRTSSRNRCFGKWCWKKWFERYVILNNRGKVGNIGEIYDSRGCRLYPVGGECFLSMQGWMKLFGAACILCGAAGTGIWFSGRYRQRILELEQLKQMVFLFKGADPVCQRAAAGSAGNRGKTGGRSPWKPVSGNSGYSGIAAREPFSAIWRNAVSEMEGKTALSKSDRQTLENLGEHLGFLDRETQERTLLLYLEQVDTELQVLREHRQERCRLYTSLGGDGRPVPCGDPGLMEGTYGSESDFFALPRWESWYL